MRWPLVVALVASGACTAGCLPERDNPIDPANAPVAKLQIVDRDNDDSEVLGAVSRGTNLWLDASGSSDPQDRFWCEFELILPQEEARSLGTTNPPCELPLGGLRYELPMDVPLVFEVAVRDSSGGLALSTATIALTNAQPIAYAGAPRSLPIRGYPWLPANTPFDVEFSGFGTDDDDDALHYCWQFPDEPQRLCRTDGDPPFIRTLLSSSSLLYVATMTVFDLPPEPLDEDLAPGARRESFPSITRVVVGPRNLWSASPTQGYLERVDVTRDVIVPSGPAAMPGVPLLGTETREARLVYGYHSDSDVVTLVSTNEDLSGKTTRNGIGGGLQGVAADPTAERVWILIEEENLSECSTECDPAATGDPCSWLVAIDPTTTPPSVESCVDVADHAINGRLTVDAAGRVFIAEFIGDEGRVSYFDPAEGTSRRDVLGHPGDLVLGFSERPDRDEYWTLVSPDYFAEYNTNALIRIGTLPLTAEGTLTESAVIELGVAVGFDIAWIGPNAFWIEVPESGLYLLDAEVLEGYRNVPYPDGGDSRLEEATIQFFPEVFDAIYLVADPVSRAVWARSQAAGDIYRATPEGDLVLFSVEDPPVNPLEVDAKGRLLFTSPGKLHRGYSASGDGVISSTPLFSRGGVEPDLTTGGIWVPLTLPPGMARLAEDGSYLDYETQVQHEGTTLTANIVRLFRVQPGGTTAYAIQAVLPFFSPGAVFRLDLATDPPTITDLVDSATQPSAGSEITRWGSVLEPSAPIPGATPFVWTILEDGSGVPMVLALPTNGNPVPIAPPFALPTPERNPLPLATPLPAGFEDNPGYVKAARSLATNDLCLVTVARNPIGNSLTDLTDDTVVARRIDVAGGIASSNFAFAAGSRIAAVAVTAGGGSGEICWLAWNEYDSAFFNQTCLTDPANCRPRIFAGRPGMGGAVSQWTGSPGDQITSIAPASGGDVWITLLRAGESIPEKIHLTYGSPPNLVETRTLSPSSRNVFVLPEARAATFDGTD